MNSFEDILRAMEQDPALRDAMRRHILTDELLQLPARVSRLEELVADIAGKLAELTAVFARYMENTDLILTALNERQARLEADVTGLKEGQARLEADVTGLKEGQARLEAGQTRMSGQLSNLIGSDYERKAARLASRRLRQQLGVSQAEILRAITVPDRMDLTHLLDRAVESGAVSAEEAEDLELTDLALRGTREDGTTVHVVIEVSITVQDEDVRRAARRAAVLKRAVSGAALPVVIGESVSRSTAALVDQEGVSFMQMDSQTT